MRLALLLSALVLTNTVVHAREGVRCTRIKSVWSAISKTCLCTPCHLCEYKIFKGTCTLIVRQDADLSDGSDIKTDQPELRPKAWFLSEEEMTASRGGVKRDQLALWTENNHVTTYAATNEYFDAVAADLDNTKHKDRVYVTGWSFDDVSLTPDVDARELNETMVTAVVARMIARGVDFHAIGWTNMIEHDQNVAFADAIRSLPAPRHGTTRFLFDDRLATTLASHHQKTVVIKRAEGLVAYVGGVDWTNGRWDTITHDQAELRVKTGIETGEYNGWMDAHIKIDGPAAKDVGHNFLARWNHKHKPLQDFVDDLLPFENPQYTTLPDLNRIEPLIVRTNGRHAVQIVRTFSCKYKHYDGIAPRGELSLFHARLKALKHAKNYIYIEDQYFLHMPELLDALLAVLPGLQRLIIIAQPPSDQSSLAGYRKYQFDILSVLQQRFPNKVQVYTPKRDRKVYIHSKLVLIDDVYVSVGSANWNRRSMTSDAELNANVVDTKSIRSGPDGIKVNTLARDLRLRKLMELSGQTYDELNAYSFLDAANSLDDAADRADSLIERYQVEENASFAVFTNSLRDVVDTYDTC